MIILFILVFVAGFAKAVMDTLLFHFYKSVFSKEGDIQNWFWCPDLSWSNKYKDHNPSLGPKFWGSTTCFVLFTDGWHLAQSVLLLTLFTSIVLYKPILSYPDMPILGTRFDYYILRGIFGLSFVLFCNKLLLK